MDTRAPQKIVSSGTVALLVLLAGGGAASHPSGALVGIPSMGTFSLALLAAAFVWISGVGGLGGFLLPVGAVGAGALLGPGSSWLLFSGRPLFALLAAALVLAVIAYGKRPPEGFLLPVMFAIYAAVAYQAQIQVGPDGDEPQYLMVADSLLHDHDLALEQDFKDRRYQEFFARPLEPHYRIRGPEGQIYSLHAVGLSLLILPAYGLGGYPGASFFMALLAAFLVRELRHLVLELTGDASTAEGTAWLVGLSPPIIHFAGLIFTEIPAALLFCVGLRSAVFGRTSRALLVSALSASALPWLNVRYAILSAAVVVAMVGRCLRRGPSESSKTFTLRELRVPALALIGSALCLGLYHFELWGFFDPRRVYGRRREFSLDIFPEGLPGLFFDQEFGLFVYAPIFVLSLAGFARLWRRNLGLGLAALLAVCGIVVTAGVWPMWRGGFNPPARFLVPLIPILAASVALALQRGIRTGFALLAGWSLWCGLFGAMNIETVHRDRDGVAPFFRSQSGALEWTSALPSFVLSEDRATRVLVWPFAVLLALPVVAAVRRQGLEPKPLRHRDTALAVAALMAAALLADRMSPRVRAPERDSTRLLGSPSILLPSLQYQPLTEAVWAVDLFYEPHRHPSGVVFARAVRLEPGRYELALLPGDDLVGAAPTLKVTERRSQKSARQPMQLRPRGLSTGSPPIDLKSLTAVFTVDTTGEFDLSLVEGGPVQISAIRVRRVAG